ncbi:MAG: HAMP domain-containing protein, partial [Armatimonadota bacterium]
MIGPEARDRICRSVVSVRAKLILALLLATVPTVGVLAYFGLESTSGLLRSQALDRMGMLAMAQAREMEDAIEHAIGDARYLARSPAVRAFARVCAGRDAPSDEARTHLLEEFVALAEASALYCQIRYLDGAGHERARIDYDGRRAHIVPERGLQDKSDRYYFREAMAAAPNEVYVSPLDLNRENGQFEQPLRPVLRFVSPVVDDGSGSGVVVLNLQAGPLLPTIRQGVSAAFVADPDGWYLSHTDAAKAWSGPENLNTGQHLRADFGRQANAVVRPEPATVQASGHLVGTWPIMINSPPRRSYLVVGVQEAEATAFAAQRDFRRFFWTLIGISFVIPVLAGLALAAYFLRPLGKLRGAVHAVAEGDLEAAADVNSCDEFQELADDFNAMAARLREHHEEERLALVGRMASGLTHDIKNALSSTTAFARLLAASDLSDEERESMADRAVAQVE